MSTNSAVKEFKGPTKSSSFLDKLSSDMSKLYLNKLWSDVKIICKGKAIYCHKNVLAARSGYFETRFRRDEDLDEIVEDDVSELTFQLVLRYIYTGIICFDGDAGEDVFLGVLSLAIKYQLTEVVNTTAEFLKPIMTAGNALKIFALTTSLKGHDLIGYCSNFISNSAENVLMTNEFNQLNMEMVVHLFKHATVANEVKMASLLNWIKHNRGADAAKLLETLDSTDEPAIDTGIGDNLDEGIGDADDGTATDNHEAVSSLLLKCESYTTETVKTETSQQAIIYELPATVSVNAIKMSLANTAGYKIFISSSADVKNVKKWTAVVDYLKYRCHSEQNLYFDSRPARLVKIVGSTAIGITKFRIYHFDMIKEITKLMEGSLVYSPNLDIGYIILEDDDDGGYDPYDDYDDRDDYDPNDDYDPRDDYDDYDDRYKQVKQRIVTDFHLNQPMVIEKFTIACQSSAIVEISDGQTWLSIGRIEQVNGVIAVSPKPRITIYVRVISESGATALRNSISVK